MRTRALCTVLDPGHGGTEALGGSSANRAIGPNGLLEKDLTLDLAQRVRGFLNGGTRVLLTREGEVNLSLADRAALARRNHAGIFVSLHFNGASDPGTDGTEVWIARGANARSRKLARLLAGRLGEVTGAGSRGIHERNFGVLLLNRHAPDTGACLIELGFLTNPECARKLESHRYRDEIAQALADSIGQVLDQPAPAALGPPPFTISASVGGKSARNKPDDVEAVKQRLHDLGFDWITVDKKMDTKTIRTIKLFQSIVTGRNVVSGDGKVDVGGKTLQWLQADNSPHWQLMPSGSVADGFVKAPPASASDTHDFGTDWMCDTVRGAGASYRDSYLKTNTSAVPISLNDVSMPQGGDTPDHAEHETGLQADLQLPRTDAKSGGILVKDSLYDRDAMRAQLQAFHAQPLFRRALLNDSVLRGEKLCRFADGHDNHAHIEILPPALVAADATLSTSLDLGEGPPLLSQATESCWSRCKELRGKSKKAGSPNSVSAARIKSETGVSVDANPYFGITQDELEAVIRAGYHSRQMPELLLALWAKEGSTRSVTAPFEIAATTEANARSLFRSSVYFFDLGTDHFIDTSRPNPHADNVFDDSDAAAPRHETHFVAQVRALVKAGLLAEDISGDINGELTVAPKTTGVFTVLPSVRFYSLSLLLADAFFTQLQAMSFPQLSIVSTALNYLHWNMGTKRFGEFLVSAEQHRKEPAHTLGGVAIDIEQWALHTKPKSTEWFQPRRNAIRFMHYVESFLPVFANSITLIKPGIEDLRRRDAHAAGYMNGKGKGTEVALDDSRQTGTPPFHDVEEGVNRAAREAVAKWDGVLARGDARVAAGLTPRVPFEPLKEIDLDKGLYGLLGKTAEFEKQRARLKAAWERDLAWIFDLSLSAVGQIEDPVLRKRLLEDTDWSKAVYVGNTGNSTPSEELFNAMAKLVPERRVPALVPFIDVDRKVTKVPGSSQKLFPEANDAFVAMRDAAAATHPPRGAAGVEIVVRSGWRSEEDQQDIAARQSNRKAVAGSRSAHRFGLAGDMNLSAPGLTVTETKTASMTNVVSMYRSPVYKWLFLYGEHFGWYPYRNEPWHWEYDPPGFPERFRTLSTTKAAGPPFSVSAAAPSAPPAQVSGWPLGVDLYGGNATNAAGFTSLKNHDKVFAILKSSQGTHADGRFPDYYGFARNAGMIRGSYHFFANKNGTHEDRFRGTIAEQANLVVSMVKRLAPGDLAPALDLEDEGRNPAAGADFGKSLALSAGGRFPLDQGIHADESGYSYRHITTYADRGAAGRRELLADIQDFQDRVETALGRTPLIYTSRMWKDSDMMNDPKVMSHYPLWTVYHGERDAAGNRSVSGIKVGAWGTSWDILQYAEDGKNGWGLTPYREPGIGIGGIDFNACHGTIYGLRGLADLGRTAPHIVGNLERIVCTQADGRLQLIEFVSGAWHIENLSAGVSAAPLAAGDPAAVSVGNEEIIVYRAQNDHIIALSHSLSGAWTVDDVTAVTGSSIAIDDPFVCVRGDEVHGLFWDTNDHQIHIQRIRGAWHAEDVTALAAGTPAARGSGVIYLHANALRVVARGGGQGHLIDMSAAAGGGAAKDLHDEAHKAGTPAPAATYRPTVYKSRGGAARIVFRGLRGDIWQIERDTLRATNLTQAANAPAAKGSPSAVLTDAVHILYRGFNDVINELYTDGATWKTREVCAYSVADPSAYVDNRGHAAVCFRSGATLKVGRLVNDKWKCEDTVPVKT